MNAVTLRPSKYEEWELLNELFLESKEHFMLVEGREPLEPLKDIRHQIGNPPSDKEITCYTIFYDEEIAGYTWILEKPNHYYYILHFYIKNAFKRQSIGTSAVKVLDYIFSEKNIHKSELLVSSSNYLGLKFWTTIGYNKIIYVEAPEENSVTTSIELELSRRF